MKQKIFAVTAAIFLTISATFANDTNPVPAIVVKELHQEFKNVSDVEWKTTAAFYKATFTVDGKPLQAFFSFDGQLIGVSRKLTVELLPLSLIKATNEKGSEKAVTDLFELLTDRGTEYFITYGTGKDQKTYKSNGNSWNRYTANEINEGL